jgi:biotin transporter BioY
MRRAYLGCTLGMLVAFGSPGAQARSVHPAIPIPITMRVDMPVLRGTYLTHRSFTATWVHVYRPLGYPTLPTELTLSRVGQQVVAKPKPQP